MPRKKSRARLWLRREGATATWIILDGGKQIRTGCPEHADQEAEKRLAEYLAQKYEAPGERRASKALIADVLLFYAKEKAPKLARPKAVASVLAKLGAFWGKLTVAAVTGQNCRRYVEHRVDQGVSEPTARRELEDFSAALNFYHKEYILDVLPVVTLPPAGLPREEWLTRSQAAHVIWTAYRRPDSRHLVRYMLIALYTGTRTAAILDLRWLPSPTSGYIDLDRGILYRRGSKERERRNKKRPPSKLHQRLAAHMERWRRQDDADGITHVVHFHGQPIKSLKRSWGIVREKSGIGEDHVLYCLKHTAATWLMQRGVDAWEAAGYLGISVEILQRVYGHHHPDFQENAAGQRRQVSNGARNVSAMIPQ